jgi:general secretion pathway protein D
MTRANGARLTLILLLANGCQQAPRPEPIAPPRTPSIVAEAEAASRDLRATIVGGEAPVPSVPSQIAPPPQRGDISLNFPAADVRVVAQAVLGDVLHAQYRVAPGVTGTVSLVTPGPVSRASVLSLFEGALRQSQLALTTIGQGFVIEPIAAAQANGPIGSNTVGYGPEIVRLQFMNADELKKLLDSVLPGVVTATDPVANTITVAGTTGQRKSARDLIAQFDVNWLRNMSFALFVPQRSDSRLIAPELEKLINAPDAPTRGLVRLITMERLNGILAVSAQRQYLEDVRRWIDILDREGESSEARLFVYNVQNGRARDLAKTLNAAFGNGSGNDRPSSDPFDPNAQGATAARGSAPPPPPVPMPGAGKAREDESSGGSSPAATLGRITADEINNAVIVYGTPRQYAVVEDALRKLDVLPYQVMIEAAITEVSLTDDLRFGVQWNFQTGDANFALTESTSSTQPTRNVPGFSFFLSGNDITATLNALEKRTNVKVVSAPKLLVLNNQTAALQVGDQVPITIQAAQSVQNPDSPIVNSVEYRDTGVILKVTPRVNAGGLVLLDIAQEVSDVAPNTVSGIDSPTIATRRVSTSIAARDGQVIALGGLFRDSRSFGKNGLPILSRIPVLGSLLFGNRVDMQRRTELIVILKPTVIRTVEDGQAITEELRAKIRTLEPFKTSGKIP